MNDLYHWIKAGHVVSVIAWMAATFYLPRLFVYHTAAEKGSVQSETFKTMERRLLRGIMTPAMIATWFFGIWAAIQGDWFSSGSYWLHAKLLFVVALTAFHGFCAKWTREFAEDRNTRPQRFYRMANELPTLLVIVIVVFAVVKPF